MQPRRAPRRYRWRGAGSGPTSIGCAEQPVEQLAARVLQHQHGPTAFADQAPAAAPPTLRPAHPSVRIRGQGDQGWLVAGAPRRAATASTARRSAIGEPGASLGRRRVRRLPTRPGDSSLPQRRTERICPIAALRRQAGCRDRSNELQTFALISHQRLASALLQSARTMTDDGCSWQSLERASACRRWSSKAEFRFRPARGGGGGMNENHRRTPCTAFAAAGPPKRSSGFGQLGGAEGG